MSIDSGRHEEATALVVGRPFLRVGWWRDERPVVGSSDPYGRRYWLPIIGPTCFLLAQSLSNALTRTPERAHPVTVPTSPLAESLGVGGSLGPHAPLVRTVARLVMFDLAIPENGVLAVSTGWPLLSHRQHRRLPAWLADLHRHDLAQVTDGRRSA